LLGDRAASDLFGALEFAAAGLRSIAEGVGGAIKAESQRHYSARPQVAELLDGIDALRLRVDRLAAGIEQLENRP
jgi:ubiquinone biosynthesis protein UbiJ